MLFHLVDCNKLFFHSAITYIAEYYYADFEDSWHGRFDDNIIIRHLLREDGTNDCSLLDAIEKNIPDRREIHMKLYFIYDYFRLE